MRISLIQDVTALPGCLKAGRTLLGGNIVILDLNCISLIVPSIFLRYCHVYFSDIVMCISQIVSCVFL